MQVKCLYECYKCKRSIDALACWLRLSHFERVPLCDKCFQALKEKRQHANG